MTHRKKKKSTEKKKKPADAMVLVISDGKAFLGTGLAFQMYITEEKHRKALEGKKIGMVFEGKEIDLPGYIFKITGGTDKYGFMHHPGVDGGELKSILLSSPPGIRFARYKVEKRGGGFKLVDLRGIARKKTVRGNVIGDKTRQINVVVVSRRGSRIKEMTKESILSDRILSPLVEKIGYLIIKNGLHRVRFVSDGEVVRLQDKLAEAGVTEQFIKKLSIDLGIGVIKRGKKLILNVIRPVLKCRGNTEFAKYVAKTLYEFYNELVAGKKDLGDEDKVIAELVDKILDGAEKALKNELKVDFRFKIKEKAS